jgi:hypothetical protein
MYRRWFVFAVLVAFAFVAVEPLSAQMGMDMFKRPAITKVFQPVVGKGAVYLDTEKDGKTSRSSEIEIVGKSLISPGDFQFHRMIIQPPGQQAMEIPMKMNAARKERVEENLTDWHSVGTETITVPAGTFSCEHWRNDKTHAEAWTSDKVSPSGMVKEISGNGNTQVLSKILDNAADRITGPVKQFDMQEMMQQMQQPHQQHPQP